MMVFAGIVGPAKKPSVSFFPEFFHKVFLSRREKEI